ncbi:MAG TPA: CocE/NonD family hydrolase, partial [Blastocatellia bacterium]|nr:CocE/NonD family hydrolase [Blastocatellia bacterium]
MKSILLEQGRRTVAELRRIATVSNAPAILFLRALVALACLAAFAPIYAGQSDSLFTRTAAMIPMRDGVRLNTQVFAPTRTGEPLPLLLLRTPYGIGELSSAQLAAALPELTADGYVIVQQDIRGRFKSEGQFVMLRQPRDPKDKKAIDESTDTYDTIEWLLKNVPHNNGRVGLAGTSYGAWLSVMGMLEPHPALKAVVTQASPADMWLGDDFHHNGA